MRYFSTFMQPEFLIARLCFSETESWFIDSLEEWRKAKDLDNFILLGHSLGGYVASRYALKVCSQLQEPELANVFFVE